MDVGKVELGQLDVQIESNRKEQTATQLFVLSQSVCRMHGQTFVANHRGITGLRLAQVLHSMAKVHIAKNEPEEAIDIWGSAAVCHLDVISFCSFG